MAKQSDMENSPRSTSQCIGRQMAVEEYKGLRRKARRIKARDIVLR